LPVERGHCWSGAPVGAAQGSAVRNMAPIAPEFGSG
jgi:hypothetical protein